MPDKHAPMNVNYHLNYLGDDMVVKFYHLDPGKLMLMIGRDTVNAVNLFVTHSQIKQIVETCIEYLLQQDSSQENKEQEQGEQS
jgi:hypothetical protein